MSENKKPLLSHSFSMDRPSLRTKEDMLLAIYADLKAGRPLPKQAEQFMEHYNTPRHPTLVRVRLLYGGETSVDILPRMVFDFLCLCDPVFAIKGLFYSFQVLLEDWDDRIEDHLWFEPVLWRETPSRRGLVYQWMFEGPSARRRAYCRYRELTHKQVPKTAILDVIQGMLRCESV